MSLLGVRGGSQVISSVVLVTLNELTSPGTGNGNSEYTYIHHSTHKQFQVIVGEGVRHVTYATTIILFMVTFYGVVIK